MTTNVHGDQIQTVTSTSLFLGVIPILTLLSSDQLRATGLQQQIGLES